MSRYKVDYTLKEEAEALEASIQELTDLAEELRSVASEMDDRDSTMASLQRQVEDCARELPELREELRLLKQTLMEAEQSYRTAEQQALALFEGETAAGETDPQPVPGEPGDVSVLEGLIRNVRETLEDVRQRVEAIHGRMAEATAAWYEDKYRPFIDNQMGMDIIGFGSGASAHAFFGGTAERTVWFDVRNLVLSSTTTFGASASSDIELSAVGSVKVAHTNGRGINPILGDSVDFGASGGLEGLELAVGYEQSVSMSEPDFRLHSVSAGGGVSIGVPVSVNAGVSRTSLNWYLDLKQLEGKINIGWTTIAFDLPEQKFGWEKEGCKDVPID